MLRSCEHKRVLTAWASEVFDYNARTRKYTRHFQLSADEPVTLQVCKDCNSWRLRRAYTKKMGTWRRAR